VRGGQLGCCGAASVQGFPKCVARMRSAFSRSRDAAAGPRRDRLHATYGTHGVRRPGRTGLASIREKREASSEVLVDDSRQVGHDQEEDDDEASRHAEAGYPDPQFASKRVVLSRGRFLFHDFLSGESQYRTPLNAGCKEPY
jgi:hypothetical protein